MWRNRDSYWEIVSQSENQTLPIQRSKPNPRKVDSNIGEGSILPQCDTK